MKTFTYTGKQTIKATIVVGKTPQDIVLVSGKTATLDETNSFVAPLIAKGLLVEVATTTTTTTTAPKPSAAPAQNSSQSNKED